MNPPADTAPGEGTGSGQDASAAGPHLDRKIPATDRKMLDDIFGDVLPDTTSDERDSGRSGGGYSEEWYRENRPPHHGG